MGELKHLRMKRKKSVPRELHAREVSTSAEALRPFPVVGIAAPSGATLGVFLDNVPSNSGAAYVIVLQHEPHGPDKLLQSLQHVAQIPVQYAQDAMRVSPNQCYVIRPSCALSLVHGVLTKPRMAAESRESSAIDTFLRTLAVDQQERALGVVLSSIGQDETFGLRAIKEAAGAVFVAGLDGKRDPCSAPEARLADVIAPVEELPGHIIAYVQHMPCLARHPLEDDAQSALEKVYVLLRTRTGHDFYYYKRSTIQRRVERRVSLHKLDSIEQYLEYLHANPSEIQLLFKELLIGVTSFFRDPSAWTKLQQEVLPGMIAGHTGDGPLRAWVAACSTGEEAYSLAIAFCEARQQLEAKPDVRIQIFATDLDHDAIEKARSGLYSESIAADVSPERLRRFFIREERGYRVCPELRELVVFAPQNILMDPPFTRLDLLSCRNFLIYLSAGLQTKLLPVFHYCLRGDGALFLGSAETIGAHTQLFRAIGSENCIYRSQAQPAVVRPFELQCALKLASGSVRPPAVSQKRTSEPAESSRVAELEHELLCAREEVQTLREEMRSSREELQLANRRLQNANEQLTLSHEELRSLNEELQAINQELQFRLDELSHTNSDIKNLMDSTDVATLFLDVELRVCRFTKPATKIFKLVANDSGRPITDLASELRTVDLAREAREVLRTLTPREKQCSTRDGRCFVMRILPYRTLEDVVAGVVITFTDGSASRAMVTNLREQITRLRQEVEVLNGRSN